MNNGNRPAVTGLFFSHRESNLKPGPALLSLWLKFGQLWRDRGA